ncbi:MAG: methyltransferase domain-containing protein [Candidatus Hydrogenedentes bacterium]|nr:methyltransferase domain-containing protein [Candidatus Hydrogenedentota bacterium]
MRDEGVCVACGGPLRFFGRRIGYAYHECLTCRSLQLVPQPTPEELEAAYRTEYVKSGHLRSAAEEAVGAAQPYYKALLAALHAHGMPSSVLEVGAGWGGLGEWLVSQGVDYRGVDLAVDMVAHCRTKGLAVERGDLFSVQGETRDALMMSAVFEHIVSHDAWLDHARTLLNPGGLFVSMQPTARFARFMGQAARAGIRSLELPQLHEVFCPPWHTVLFSINGMQRLMARHGFRLLDVRPGPQGIGRGLTGAAKWALGAVNKAGWPMLGAKWPFVICHIFVFRKEHDSPI